jgi:hypothetical protein
MSIVSRRTIGQILLAYDDGTSPPVEVLPLGSLVSVADGTLWISLGGGTYAQASGGGALGDSTVWSSRADWADLGTLPSGDIRSGDLAPISDLGGFSISYGTAIYNGGWALFSGYFQDPADLIAFTQPINAGAVVSVGAANEDGIRYYYDGGQWVRTPDATGYFWQSAPDWPTLLTTYPVDNLRSGDFCLATSLDIAYGAAYGIATWDGTAWKLFLGVFESVADMEAFAIAYSVTYGAIASVYPGAVDSELSVRFFWDDTVPAWVRTPDTVPYAWSISSLFDFSAIGLQEGDYGYYGNTLYRYAAAVSVTGGGVTPMWLPPAVYAGTPTVRAQLVGTEAIGALPVTVNGVTFAVVSSPPITSTVTQASDYIQFQAFTGTGNIIHGTALYTMGSTVRNYMQVEISVTYTGTSGAITRIFASEGNGQPAWYFHLGPSGSISPLPYFAAGTTLQGSQEAIRDGGIAFPSNASGNYTMTEFVDSGRNVAAECFMNGISYARSRRSSTTAGFSNPGAGVGFYMQSNSFGAGGTMTTRIRNWRVITW